MSRLGAQRGESGDLTQEEIHHVLSNERRRIVIKSLREIDGELSLRELAERIAVVETGEDPPPRSARRSVYTSLHQAHLPKLADLGIIDYDDRRKYVKLEDGVDSVTVHMETVPKHGISWSEYYFGLSVLAFLVIVGSETGVPILSILSGLTWAYLFLAFIGASAIYQTYRQGNSILTRLQT